MSRGSIWAKSPPPSPRYAALIRGEIGIDELFPEEEEQVDVIEDHNDLEEGEIGGSKKRKKSKNKKKKKKKKKKKDKDGNSRKRRKSNANLPGPRPLPIIDTGPSSFGAR